MINNTLAKKRIIAAVAVTVVLIAAIVAVPVIRREICYGTVVGECDNQELVELYSQVKEVSVEKIEAVAQIICDSYNYSVEREYANKVNAELREKDYKLMKEEKLRIEMEKSLRDIELKALHYQINPHFLFNVLNTIGRLAFFENAKMTEDVVYAFADMMRYILRKSRDPLSPLREELTHVQNYLKIQKIRLGSRLQYSINISEAYYSVKLPLSALMLMEFSVKVK